MSIRRLALVGTAVGPFIRTDRIKTPVLRVTGLPTGGTVHVRLFRGENVQELQAAGNGELDVPYAEWMQVHCNAPKGHRTICSILTKRSA